MAIKVFYGPKKSTFFSSTEKECNEQFDSFFVPDGGVNLKSNERICAEKIYKSFFDILMDNDNAMSCSLICIDLIIKNLSFSGSFNETKAWHNEIVYYTTVKEEINKIYL